MENDKLKLLKKIIILMLIIILIGSIAYLIYTKFIKKPLSNGVESNRVEVDKSLNIELDDIIILIKDYYYKNNLVKEDNLINWTINKSTYIGYTSENKNLKYYLIEGEYSCKDKGNDCVYLAVTDEPKEKNDYKIYALIDESQEEKKLELIEQTINTDDTFIKTDVLVPSTNDSFNKVSLALKDFYFSNSLMDSGNLSEWNIKSIQYIKKENNLIYYQVSGTYSCKDNSSECLYFEQVEDPVNNNYSFNIIIQTIEDNGKIQVKNIENNIYYPNENSNNQTDVSASSSTNDTFSRVSLALKDFYSKNNFVDNGNLKEWNIKSIQYIKKENNLTYYQVSGTYSCKDNSGECLYFEQISESINNNYSFDIIIQTKEENGNLQVKNVENNIYYQEGNANNQNNTEQNKESNITKENLIKELKQYVRNRGLLTENNILTWDITEVTYIGYYKENSSVRTYKFEGTYSCKDGESDCIYLEVVDDGVKNGVYPYLIHADFDVTNNTLSIKQIYGGLFVSDNFIFVNEKAK